MNANELAEIIEHLENARYIGASKAATMLRQQQDEIEALKANRKHDFGLGEASGFIKGHKENPYKAITNTKIEPTVVSYTHPVKELTDEEKTELENAIKVCEYKYFGSYPLSEKQWEAFELLEKHAKAILRKAQHQHLPHSYL